MMVVRIKSIRCFPYTNLHNRLPLTTAPKTTKKAAPVASRYRHLRTPISGDTRTSSKKPSHPTHARGCCNSKQILPTTASLLDSVAAAADEEILVFVFRLYSRFSQNNTHPPSRRLRPPKTTEQRFCIFSCFSSFYPNTRLESVRETKTVCRLSANRANAV